MAKAAAGKPAPKKPRATRTRKTEEQQLQEALARVEALQSKQAEKGEKKDTARVKVREAADRVAELLDAVLDDPKRLPDFRAATVEFGRAVKEADALGALGDEEAPASEPDNEGLAD